jgi:tether containing UBX domain for GLUT4
MMIIAEELPDDYFTPTITDLKARQQHLHARAVGLNNAPLLTRAQREEQAKMKRDRWPNVRTLPVSRTTSYM